MILLGSVITSFAYPLTRFNEQVDAIGSTTPAEEVEPAMWNVMLTRLLGIALAGGGVLWVLTKLV